MPKTVNAATVGALVRDARTEAGLTQTELANRIGASRYWVAEFEKGKPTAALGLALKALHALGLVVHIEPPAAARARVGPPKAQRGSAHTDNLTKVIARATLKQTARSGVLGWPTASASSRRPRKV